MSHLTHFVMQKARIHLANFYDIPLTFKTLIKILLVKELIKMLGIKFYPVLGKFPLVGASWTIVDQHWVNLTHY